MTTPAWLTQMVDQRLALVRQALREGGITKDFGVVMTTLTEPAEGADIDQWERTCDNCGTYCPDDVAFFTGQSTAMVDDVQVIVTFGLCETCKDLP